MVGGTTTYRSGPTNPGRSDAPGEPPDIEPGDIELGVGPGGIEPGRIEPGGIDPDRLATSLRESGFEVDTRMRIARSVLDSFDGRLAKAGLRLEWTEAAATSRRPRTGELVLRGGGAPAQVTGNGPPRRAVDVVPGPLRLRLARLLEDRALLPLVTLTTDRMVAVKRNGAGKITATATVHGKPSVGDGAAAGAHGVLADTSFVEIGELAGYPKPAQQLRSLIESLGLVDAGGDLMALAAVAARVDLTGCSIDPGVPLAAGTPALVGFRDVLANLRDAMVANWEGTVADVDSEFLHDLRVAVRRTRAILAHAKRVLPDHIRGPARDDFGWLGQLTGPARDLDVYQIEWPAYVGQLGEGASTALEPVRDHLESQRLAAHATLAEALVGKRARRLIDDWSAWLDSPADPDDRGEDADRPIDELVAKRIRRAHRTMIERGRTIGPTTPAEVLHELRKDAKKLRYLLECFGGLYESGPRKAFVQRLKALQDNLGEHQDAEVHVQQLRDLSDTLAASSTTDTILTVGQLIERMEQRRLASREEFAERFEAFDSTKTNKALSRLLASTSS